MKNNFPILFVFFISYGFSQNVTVSGKITNTDNRPLSFCDIYIKNTSTGTQSDADGYYKIKTQINDTLVFSFFGYAPYSAVITGEEIINIILKEDKNLLNTIVVTSLGIKKEKKKLSYSTQELKSKELTIAKDPNLINTLSGKIAGLVVNKNASGLGGSTKVVIRGNSSTRNNQPLYVIDGIPILNISSNQPNDTFGGIAARDGGDLISQLNPESFESVNVLKGAAATALYGILGANGVIVFSTNQKTNKKLSVSINSTTTVEEVFVLPEFQSQYRAPTFDSEFSWTENNDRDNFNDHVPRFFETGINQTTAFNLTNMKDNSFTSLNLANISAKGVLPKNTLERYNIGLRHSASFLDKKLSLKASINYAQTKTNNRPNTGLYLNPITGLYLMPRGNSNDFNEFKNNFEVFDPNRNLMSQNWPILNNALQQNPYWELNRNQSNDNTTLLFSSLGLNYQIKPWLSVSGRYSYTNSSSKFEKKLHATTTLVHAGEAGSYYLEESQSTQKYADLIANLNTIISNDFSVDATIGFSLLNRRIGDGFFINGDLLYANIFNISGLQPGANQGQNLVAENEIQSFFTTTTFGFKDYLFLQLSARNDWSSSLVNTQNTSFFYPSVGLSTVISDMTTLPNMFNFLKLRASYSQVGNDIAAFVSSPLSTIVNGQITPPIVGPDPNRPLKPELKKEFEIGTEMRLFNNRISLEASYYNSQTSNQYVEVLAPTNPQGFQKFGINVGQISNKGFELFMNAKMIKNSNFKWNLYTNFAINDNIVEELGDNTSGEIVLTESGSNGYQYSLIEDQAFGVIKGRVVERDNQGNIKLNNDGDIMLSKDFINVGNANPDFLLSLGNTFAYNNFYASFLIDGRFGGEVMSMTESINDFYGVSKASGTARTNGGVAISAVYPDGAAFDGLYPAQDYYTTIAGRDGALGEYVYDATNIILRELAIGYNINTKKIPYINKLEVSLIARNLFFISKNAPFDPNISLSTGRGLQGVDIFGLPSTRTFGININSKF